MPKWDEVKREWETTKITLKDLAEKHDIKLGTLKSRKSREGWSRDPTKKDATKKQRLQPKNEIKEPIAESDDLTGKQRLFCIHYIKCFNATKAYQKAYKCDYTTAMTNGSRLLRNAKISAEIDHLKAEQATELKLDARDILQKYIDIAFADITDFVEFGTSERQELDMDGKPLLDEDGNPITYLISQVNFKQDYEVDGTLISEVKKGKDGVSVKLADKMKALDVLSKYVDLLSDNDKKRLQQEKLKADIVKVEADAEFSKERADKLKGKKKDTGLLDALIEGRKLYEQNGN